MAHKGATRRTDPGRRPGGLPAAAIPARRAAATAGIERALFAVLGLDVALGTLMLYVHARLLATGGAYTSFCNVNAHVNCDAVLTSRYATVFGVPVAAWAVLTYMALATLLVWRQRAGAGARQRATLAVLGLATFNLVFSLYMAALAGFAIRALCLLCMAMYVLNAVVALLAWRLATRDAGGPTPLVSPRRALIGAGMIAAALAVVGARQLGASSAADNLTPAEVRARDPKFYEWYSALPVVSMADLPGGEHARGPADAAITIVEFSDFECGYCAKAFHDLREVERQHGGHVRIVFHHFPLDSECNPHVPSRLHPDACLAAIAAECAAGAGRFWDYHDRLFDNQDRLAREDLIAAAVDLGLDRREFTACLGDPASRARVLADAHAGARLGVKSTPTLFVNGRTIEGALDRTAYEYVFALERRG